MEGIAKRFGAVQALANVDFDLRPREIHGLLGENGAGKTTLMNILYGLVPADAGRIRFAGATARLRSPQDAIRQGVGMVHQHFMLVPTLTVAEHMILGEQGSPLLRKGDFAAVATRLEELRARYGLYVDPFAEVWQLSVGEQQRVEILRALYRGARILILDEPTATLTPPETEQLLPKLRSLADEGASVVFITHHLQEVVEWTDRITVLRRGQRVATLRPGETTAQELARMMVGHVVSVGQLAAVGATGAAEGEHRALHGDGGTAAEPVLVASGLCATSERGTSALEDVSFSVGPGEIVAVAGVEGNGQAELEEVLFGLRTLSAALSGGNAQRVVLARTLSRESRFLIAAQPTRGLDVGGCRRLHRHDDELRRASEARREAPRCRRRGRRRQDSHLGRHGLRLRNIRGLGARGRRTGLDQAQRVARRRRARERDPLAVTWRVRRRSWQGSPISFGREVTQIGRADHRSFPAVVCPDPVPKACP